MSHIMLLLRRLLVILIIYFICRLLFLVFHFDFFSNLPGNVFMALLHGFRFDISAVVFTNILFIAFHLIPAPLSIPIKETLLKVLFYLSNLPWIFMNCVDLAYFRFTFKRTTADLFEVIRLGDDLGHMLPGLIRDFWFVPGIFAGLIYLTEMLYRKTGPLSDGFNKKNMGMRLAGSLITVVFLFYAARGGTQLRPIGIINAAEPAGTGFAPLVANTPFCILKTIGKQSLEEVRYFSAEKAGKIFSPVHSPDKTKSFRKLNVVILILESFATEYIGSLNGYGKGYTPFLDSLIRHSLVFPNGMANGKKSIEGLPSITAGIPSLMNTPYITSAYGSNHINSIASLLKKKGYYTAFFHGGNNGTMGFDQFAKAAGFEHYFGRNEYHNDTHFDGTWGIYDEEFYRFFNRKLNHMKEPFVCTFFSLSSHHPYRLPPRYRGRFDKGTLSIHESIGYADYSLRTFFEEASLSPWFKHTIFVITADHTALSDQPRFNTSTGAFRVPVIFYGPGLIPASRNPRPAQHTDILPTLLDLIHFDEPFISFGKSLADSTGNDFAVNYLNGIYQLVTSDMLLQFDGTKTIGLYFYQTDTLLSANLADKMPREKQRLEEMLKAIIQQYNYRMVNNKLSAGPK